MGVLIILILSGCGIKDFPSQTTTSMYQRSEIISSPDVAKQLLMDGNQRFVTGKLLSKDLSFAKRSDLLKGQHPFAVVVSCSDSRVPPELLFDQALGDLFVVRVAGNVVDPIELGSVEYAVEHLKTPLVVVLGHERCGAVTTAAQGDPTEDNLGAIIKRIKPAVDKAKANGFQGNELIEKSVEINIQNTMADISKNSIIKNALENKRIKILGLKYDLDDGILKQID